MQHPFRFGKFHYSWLISKAELENFTAIIMQMYEDVKANLVIFKSISSGLSNVYHEKWWCNLKDLFHKKRDDLQYDFYGHEILNHMT